MIDIILNLTLVVIVIEVVIDKKNIRTMYLIILFN